MVGVESVKKMKIVTGMGNIDDYPSYVHSGSDEVFVGYIPKEWLLLHGNQKPFNRREVLYYNVQLGSESELLILKEMTSHYQIPATITLNAIAYEENDYEVIMKTIKKCIHMGFHRFIVADDRLIRLMAGIGYCEIIVSGEYGEMNEEIIRYFKDLGVKRIIFPRQTTIQEMKEMIQIAPELEYEAFVLNEKCHFTGAYCQSMHCDEFCHICKIPYHFVQSDTGSIINRLIDYDESMERDYEEEKRNFGETGCGLCALWQLKDIGITHLKLVSRGNATDATIEDIQTIHKALQVLEDSTSEKDYIERMKAILFPQGCSGNCYYYKQHLF